MTTTRLPLLEAGFATGRQGCVLSWTWWKKIQITKTAPVGLLPILLVFPFVTIADCRSVPPLVINPNIPSEAACNHSGSVEFYVEEGGKEATLEQWCSAKNFQCTVLNNKALLTPPSEFSLHYGAHLVCKEAITKNIVEKISLVSPSNGQAEEYTCYLHPNFTTSLTGGTDGVDRDSHHVGPCHWLHLQNGARNRTDTDNIVLGNHSDDLLQETGRYVYTCIMNVKGDGGKVGKGIAIVDMELSTTEPVDNLRCVYHKKPMYLMTTQTTTYDPEPLGTDPGMLISPEHHTGVAIAVTVSILVIVGLPVLVVVWYYICYRKGRCRPCNHGDPRLDTSQSPVLQPLNGPPAAEVAEIEH